MNILEEFGLRQVSAYRSGHGTVAGAPLPDQIVGVELEIERWSFGEVGEAFGGCTFTQDGSLRNNGIEAVTKPIYVKHLQNWLTAFFSAYHVSQDNYSERCSTHVHFNVQNLTVDQITTICLVYQTVESLLFEYVDNDRENNIFCVPWNQCNLNFDIVTRLARSPGDANAVFRRWQKYAALNLIPVASQGTMEFRHLHGTCDVRTIMEWVCIISSIFKYAQHKSLDEAKSQILNMNTVSNYGTWMFDVFGPLASVLQKPGYEKKLAVGVVDSKLMLLNQGVDNYIPPPEPFLGEEIHDDFFDEGLDDAAEPIPVPRDVLQRYQEQIERNARMRRMADNVVARNAAVGGYNINVHGANQYFAQGNFANAAVPQPLIYDDVVIAAGNRWAINPNNGNGN